MSSSVEKRLSYTEPTESIEAQKTDCPTPPNLRIQEIKLEEGIRFPSPREQQTYNARRKLGMAALARRIALTPKSLTMTENEKLVKDLSQRKVEPKDLSQSEIENKTDSQESWLTNLWTGFISIFR